jgi:RNA polymerase sigma-70 factor (ECF subfamily)
MSLIKMQNQGQPSVHEARSRFEAVALPHLNAAYNLARWLTHNDHDAEDGVQEAFLRAFKSFDSFYGINARAWLLTIVRNTCYTWLSRSRSHGSPASIEDEIYEVQSDAPNPQDLLLKLEDNRLLGEALEELPVEFREVLILRELEGFSYKEIAEVVGIQPGTVMSRLARARGRLKKSLAIRMNRDT